ncbi:hypothetical protein [Methyloceanibacter superfactus]|uniref:hypothetical protein n=1 Tax=Methyloceanibacter superfactus TaxID=1774969 RepID=UPI00114D300C|nr:hypothetical protein [Methyloceanibacter superfactus]
MFYSVTSLAAVVGLVAAHGYPAIAPRFMSRYREQGKDRLIAAFVARARKDAAVYVAFATAGVLAIALWWPSLSFEARLATAAAALSIPATPRSVSTARSPPPSDASRWLICPTPASGRSCCSVACCCSSRRASRSRRAMSRFC